MQTFPAMNMDQRQANNNQWSTHCLSNRIPENESSLIKSHLLVYRNTRLQPNNVTTVFIVLPPSGVSVNFFSPCLYGHFFILGLQPVFDVNNLFALYCKYFIKIFVCIFYFALFYKLFILSIIPMYLSWGLSVPSHIFFYIRIFNLTLFSKVYVGICSWNRGNIFYSNDKSYPFLKIVAISENLACSEKH